MIGDPPDPDLSPEDLSSVLLVWGVMTLNWRVRTGTHPEDERGLPESERAKGAPTFEDAKQEFFAAKRPRPRANRSWSLLEDALSMAVRLHTPQDRKGTRIPYISHLLSVCALVLENGGTEVEAVAALLHDAVEDQGGLPTLKRIRQEFGDEVAAIVEACSDTDEAQKPPWRERKLRHLEHLRTASRSVLLVAAADKLHNARSVFADLRKVGLRVYERFNQDAGREGTIWYYRELAKLFRSCEVGFLAQELSRVVDEIVELTSELLERTERPGREAKGA